MVTEINIDKLFLLKELSDGKKTISRGLLMEFEINYELEELEIRKQVLEIFKSNKPILKENLENLTTEIRNLMQNFTSSSNRFMNGAHRNSGRNARLCLNGLVNLKTEWNKKSIILFN